MSYTPCTVWVSMTQPTPAKQKAQRKNCPEPALSDAGLTRLRAMRAEKQSYAQIQAALGISKTTVSRALNGRGAYRTNPVHKDFALTYESMNELRELLKLKVRHKVIAEKLGVSKSTILRAIHHQGPYRGCGV